MLTRFRRYFTKGDNNQSKSNYHQGKTYLSSSYQIIKIHNSSSIFSALIAQYKLTITPVKLAVNTIKFELAKSVTSQNAVRFEHIAENTFSCGLPISKESLIYINNNKRLEI